MSDNSTEDEDAELDPLSRHKLHEFHKETVEGDVMIRKDATKYMKQQLHNTSRELILLAQENMEEREGKILEKQDVEAAFEDAYAPYHLMQDFLTVMEEYERDLKREASRTNILDFDFDDD